MGARITFVAALVLLLTGYAMAAEVVVEDFEDPGTFALESVDADSGNKVDCSVAGETADVHEGKAAVKLTYDIKAGWSSVQLVRQDGREFTGTPAEITLWTKTPAPSPNCKIYVVLRDSEGELLPYLVATNTQGGWAANVSPGKISIDDIPLFVQAKKNGQVDGAWALDRIFVFSRKPEKYEIILDHLIVQGADVAAAPVAQGLIVRFTCTAPSWASQHFVCTPGIQLAESPQEMSVLVQVDTPSGESVTTPVAYIRSADGKDSTIDFGKCFGAGGGKAGRQTVAAKLEGQPPYTLGTIAIYSKGPQRDAIVYLRDIAAEGRSLGAFGMGREWKKAEANPGMKGTCKVGGRSDYLAMIRDKAARLEQPVEVEGSLITNASLEENFDGWVAVANAADAAVVPQAAVPQKKTLAAKCVVDEAGVESFRSAKIEVGAQNSWGAWVVPAKQIKPDTDYTLSFWYRQSQEGTLSFSLFDAVDIRLPQLLAENPNHWLRYSMTVNSEQHSGDAPLVFLAQSGDGPATASVDEVYLHEGSSPIGYNRVHLRYQYYNTLYISPDVTSPMECRFEFQFDDKQEPEDLFYVLELPADVAVEDYFLSYGSLYWRTITKRQDEDFSRDGQPWKRYTVSLRRPLGEDRAQRFYAPVGDRDGTKWGGYGNYSGYRTLTWYLSTKLTEGERYGYYYAKWPATSTRPAGEQPPRKFRVMVVRVPQVPPFKRFRVYQTMDAADFIYNPTLPRDLARIGVTGLISGVLGKDRAEGRQVMARVEPTGIRDFGSFGNLPQFYSPKDPEAHGMEMDGSRTDNPTGDPEYRKAGWCLSYRGPEWKATLDKEFVPLIEDGFRAIFHDDCGPTVCFCPKCREAFKDFVTKYTVGNGRRTIPDPTKFMKEGKPENYVKLWKDFQTFQYGRACQDMRQYLEAVMREKGLSGRLVIVSTSSPIQYNSGSSATASWPGAIDYLAPQTYLNWSWGLFFGNPWRAGEELLPKYQAAMGQHADAVPGMSLLSPGLTYCHPALCHDPQDVHGYQILENVMSAKVAGYSVYAGADLDLGDMKAMAWANSLIARVEDIILDGTVDRTIKVVSRAAGSDSGVQSPESGKPAIRHPQSAIGGGTVRAKRLGNRLLMLVSDYSTFDPIRTTVELEVPTERAMTFKDVETGRVVANVSKGNGRFSVRLNEKRAMLLLGE